ncbi:pyridoxal phosphate-dependent aminotransferase [Acidilobus sp.]|uniref:pyridoxal phosphate-dependent aminotransferase n=1 Tax=Acidilobus sp. TaxID=1872109 RepID=UPI003CFE06B6
MSNEPPTLGLKQEMFLIQGESAFSYLPIIRELESKGIKVISFGIGQPDFPTPKHIREAAKDALDQGFTGYTETAGIPELREAIAEYLNSRYRSDVKPDEIIVTTGTKTALFMAGAAYLRPGDEALIIEPSYYAYAQVTKFFGARPRFVSMDFEPGKGFSLDIGKVEDAITDRTRLLFLNNPNNPTGVVIGPRQVEELMEVAAKKNVIVVADEIYDNFIYEGEFGSTISHPGWRDNLLYINGFSKTFSMTGWRLGYLVARREVISRMLDLAVSIYSCATSIAQKAGVAALRGDWTPVRNMIDEFRKRRDALYNLLKEVPGFESYKPQGAFYMFPRVSQLVKALGLDSVDKLVNRLLYEKGVLVLPGTTFPDRLGRDFVRFSFATSMDNIVEGVKRIAEFAAEAMKR